MCVCVVKLECAEMPPEWCPSSERQRARACEIVCICVSRCLPSSVFLEKVREGERGRERETEKERKKRRETERESVCVCALLHGDVSRRLLSNVRLEREGERERERRRGGGGGGERDGERTCARERDIKTERGRERESASER